jgi:hypothetical protein
MDSDEVSKVLLGEEDWEAIWRRLTVFALKLAGEKPDVFDGISPDDLVGETIVTFWASDNNLNWDPQKNTLVGYLCGVLKKKFLMHARRAVCSPISPDEDACSAAATADAGDTVRTLISIDEIRAAARGDKELEELITATQQLDNSTSINQRLSEVLQTTAEDIVNRKKRLRRRLERGRLDHNSTHQRASSHERDERDRKWHGE